MKPILIGIAGGTGSGKTTVTQKLIEHLHFSRGSRRTPSENLFEKDVVVLQHDSYYKDISDFRSNKISEINFDHPNSLDTSLLVRHLKRLKNSQPIEKPVYDFTTYRRLKEKELIQPKKVIILEGILIFVDKALRDLMDIKVFVDTDADERLLRRLKRDIVERGRSLDAVMTQYINTVKPMHLEFVEPSKRWADVIIPKGGENEVAIGMLASRIRWFINGEK